MMEEENHMDMNYIMDDRIDLDVDMCMCGEDDS